MAEHEISGSSATLNERLLSESERGETTVPNASTTMRKKVLLGLLAAVGVACLVIGAVAASGRSLSPSATSSSSSGASFSVVSENVLQQRPTFTAPVGSLANAPEPNVTARTANTEAASFSFEHSHILPDGSTSHTHLHYNVVKSRNAHCPSNHEQVLAIDCLPNEFAFPSPTPRLRVNTLSSGSMAPSSFCAMNGAAGPTCAALPAIPSHAVASCLWTQ
eukprot:m.48390 g.48390  ORF g.48390 m.48390 type:complete len:220 (-) comp11376_c1_seq1:56-715(-)